ncbi:MAG: tetratricopeptide repeat protein [Candidatus Aminicenantes bacterium]|nr:tetratricopeptide repeat protein [Candidatus Aminicenantes bacterium]NIM83846.1 tetratricopeptide repeat protein [Candidatus Aminicenantes bacterium]NIN23310.1 tetratricopeptide repeat protein [Candidatus Aminicenantes bacterium]NIN47014.1 tetratricopeptide repeat protein [Candidatus Aminicenantes bacterium]NIN89936.1 tetratricopeptide repeat protein [Candidatus Aminicenantes bacterium]
MKRKEREHLKEDPFRQFIQKVLAFLKQYQKLIYIGIGVVVAAGIIIAALVVIQFLSVGSENRLYAEALNIKNDGTLNVEQKIEKLSQFPSKSGISAAVKLFLASLYFEKGDLEKSKEALKGFSSSKYKLINDQKMLLEANILIASDKTKEALELLNKLVSSPQSEVAKDFILLKMARIQVRMDQEEAAINNLKKITDEYPQSFYSYEARNLLNELEGD